MRLPLALLLSALLLPSASAQEHRYLYKTTLVQAAPGRILDLIELYQQKNAQDAGDASPLWMRHSQGDHWDLLLLFPMGSYDDYYGAGRVSRRQKAARAWSERLGQDVAWQEDVLVYGPPPEEVRKAFAGSSLFHVEMFHALPGKQAELYQQREMENAYSKALQQPENLIFVRDQGAAWDLFTIGCFRNLKHYAESEDVPHKDQEAAARAAGFEGADRIGPYLRTLIASHHDTLAVAVK